ncbi:prepilin peptidase [Patescibacteria group bacterium]|nr:prepilin peptidase [Patescibacteria group bacterium]
MLEALPYVFLGFLGLTVGSFLNVVILRFGFSESRQERSHCMNCGTQIRAHDLIPVFSFFALGGKCRSCGSKLSLQYPLVEIALAVLFLLAWHVVPPVYSLWSGAAFISLLVFLSSLLALVVYDIRHTLVPMQFIYVLLLSAASAPLFQSLHLSSYQPFLDALAGGAALAGFLYALHLITKGKGMGMGDVYIAGAVGLLLGLFRGIEALMFAVWIGTIFYLGVMLLSSVLRALRLSRRSARVNMKTELPFVPFLAVGVLVAIFTDISPLAFGTWLSETLWYR